MIVLASLAFASVVIGARIRLRLPWFAKFAILLPLLASYAGHLLEDAAGLPLALAVLVAVAGACLAVAVIPHALCCSVDHPSDTRAAIGALALIALALHAFFDAELLRIASSWHLAALVIAHKVTDGIVLGTLLAHRTPRSRNVAILASAAATPAGLLVSEELADGVLHAAIAAFVLGFYLYTAYRLVRQPARDAHA